MAETTKEQLYPVEFDTHERLEIEKSLKIVLEGLGEIEDQRLREGCEKILHDHFGRIITAPGSRSNHQAWKGGYIGHIAETFTIGRALIQLHPNRQQPYTAGDFYFVMFLHDIEKPFAYSFDENGAIVAEPELKEKVAKKTFRSDLIQKYGLELSDLHLNAFQYVEGIPTDEYKQGDRVMNELAAICNMSDTGSARAWHSYPKH